MGIPEDLTAFCQRLKHTVRQWTGLPISIGIAETKTLAKIANRLAKTSAKTDGVLDLTGERWRDRALASTEVGNIWGIGRQYAQETQPQRRHDGPRSRRGGPMVGSARRWASAG